MVFDYSNLKQATQTQCSWSAQSHGFESAMWLWIELWEECWLHEQRAERVWSEVSGCCNIWLLVRASKHCLCTRGIYT